jgi:hypothetical protein
VCSCFSSDFCNFKIWPGGQEVPEDDDDEHTNEMDDEEEDEEGERRANSAPSSPFQFVLVQIASGIFCLLITFSPFSLHNFISSI